MHYQLWDVESANVLEIFASESQGLAMVRELLAAGWDADHLALGLDFDEGEAGDDAALPPVLHGAELRRRALLAGTDGTALSV